jgi:hypothetical protein
MQLERYVPAQKNFDSIIVGYYERDDLDLRCARPGRFRSGPAGEGVRAFPQARNQVLPLFEPAPTREGQTRDRLHQQCPFNARGFPENIRDAGDHPQCARPHWRWPR